MGCGSSSQAVSVPGTVPLGLEPQALQQKQSFEENTRIPAPDEKKDIIASESFETPVNLKPDYASVTVAEEIHPPPASVVPVTRPPPDEAATADTRPRAFAESICGFGKCLDGEARANKVVIYFMIRVRVEAADGTVRHVTVYRRFSQFEILREILLQNKDKHGDSIPSMPKKKYFGAQRNFRFLNQRLSDLGQWLSLIRELPAVQASDYYNLFLTEEADESPPQFQIMKTIDAIGLTRTASAVSEAFSDDESDDSAADSGFSDDKLANPPNLSSVAVTSPTTIPPPPSQTASAMVMNTELNAATSLPARVRSPSVRAAFELGARRTPKIYFDGISSFGMGLDKDAKIRRFKKVVYYVIKIRYTDEQKCLELKICVYRRFSQFELLRENLLRSSLHGEIPPLPNKKLFGRINNNIENAMNRKIDLDKWLQEVAVLPHIRSDEYYKDFVTSGANKPPEDYIDIDYSRP